ncbi:hypothetical protein AS593_17200 [Caulobacter vibrioides]|nr:hypothetical protein AS593_17200 [Caulobacter vibrioides]
MKTFSATDAAISGFVLVREHFKTVAIWILLATIASATLNVSGLVLFGAQLQILAEAQASGQTDTPEVRQAMAEMGPFLAVSIAYVVIYYAVLQAAIYRLLLRPQERSYAALRFGGDELRLIAVNFLLGLLITAGAFAAAFVLGIVVGIVAALSKPLGALLGLLAFVALLGGMVYANVRLSFASVRTFISRRIQLFDTLPMTAQRFWPMMGAYFVALALAAIVYLLVMCIVVALGTAISGGDLGSVSDLIRSDFSSPKSFVTPVGVMRLALSGLMAILFCVTVYTPAPMIYSLIADPEPETDPKASGPFAV